MLKFWQTIYDTSENKVWTDDGVSGLARDDKNLESQSGLTTLDNVYQASISGHPFSQTSDDTSWTLTYLFWADVYWRTLI